MTAAWYGHLKFKARPRWGVVMARWGIAFFEYCRQVPANRLGHAVHSAPQPTGLQEITPCWSSPVPPVWHLGEAIKWNQSPASC